MLNHKILSIFFSLISAISASADADAAWIWESPPAHLLAQRQNPENFQRRGPLISDSQIAGLTRLNGVIKRGNTRQLRSFSDLFSQEHKKLIELQAKTKQNEVQNSQEQQQQQQQQKQPEFQTFAYLDVHHPQSPYGLIQEVLSPKQSRPLPTNLFEKDLGGLSKQEVWMSDGNLLVLKGGLTKSEGFDNSWPPLDDFEAPYREPILAPTTNSLTNNEIEGIVSILPPPPAILSKYKKATNSNFPPKLKSNLNFPSKQKSPVVKPVSASISSSGGGFFPSLLIPNVNNANNNHVSIPTITTTTRTITKPTLAPAISDSGFVPVTPKWYSPQAAKSVTKKPKLTSFRSQSDSLETLRYSRQLPAFKSRPSLSKKPEVQTFDRLILPSGKGQVLAPNSNLRQVWSQISAAKPVWSERQRPSSWRSSFQRQPKNSSQNIVVKHGIYPLKKKKPKSLFASNRRNFRTSRLYYL